MAKVLQRSKDIQKFKRLLFTFSNAAPSIGTRLADFHSYLPAAKNIEKKPKLCQDKIQRHDCQPQSQRKSSTSISDYRRKPKPIIANPKTKIFETKSKPMMLEPITSCL